MDQPKPADPTLYRLSDDDLPVLLAKRCTVCGAMAFPPQSFGCETCGAGAGSLIGAELDTAGVVNSSATVQPRLAGSAAPYAIAEIALDAGPTIRAMLDTPTDEGVRIGDRAHAVLVAPDDDPGNPSADQLLELRFSVVPASDTATPARSLKPGAPTAARQSAAAPARRSARIPTRTLGDLRPVYVVGVGLHRYQRPSDTTYVELGLGAVRAALADGGLDWPVVDSAFTANVNIGFAAGRTMLRYLGTTGIAMAQVENASASGSTAFRLACEEVAAGTAEVALAVGVDKAALPNMAITKTGLHNLVAARMLPVTHFALLANAYLERWGLDPEVLGLVAVKNHRNGSANPFAQRQKVRTLDEVMGEEPLAGSLTRLQCCPIGEGAAAAIVASGDAIDALGLDRTRAVRVRASVARSEEVYPPGTNWDTALSGQTAAQALEEAGVDPADLDVVEMHDAFTIEELLYIEALGLCAPGEAGPLLREGAWDVGGQCAVSASGGLLAMGHPLGPTGIGQVAELAMQLRGEAGARQQPGARLGLAHMVGVGAVCVVHILQAPT